MGKANQPMQANKKKSLRLVFIHSSFKSYKTWRVLHVIIKQYRDYQKKITNNKMKKEKEINF